METRLSPSHASFFSCPPSACSGVQDLGKDRVGSLPESPFPREPSPDPVLIWPGYAKNNTDAKACKPQTLGRRPPQAQLLCSSLHFPSVNRVAVRMVPQGVKEEAVERSQTPGRTCSHTHAHVHSLGHSERCLLDFSGLRLLSFLLPRLLTPTQSSFHTVCSEV